MTISIIMPVYNVRMYVAEAVRSVLAQGREELDFDIELICVDDSSTDGSPEALQEFGSALTRVVRTQNGGISAARNDGLQYASGAYVAFLDADDVWEPRKLAAQVRQLEERPELEAVFAHFESFISPELPEEVRRTRYCPPAALPGYIASALLIRRASFDRIGLFKQELRVGEFVDWMARAREKQLACAMLEEPLVRRRIHQNNTGVRSRSMRGDYLKVVRAAMRRRRA